MIIQTRQETLRLIKQHDHGLLAGELAHAWRLPSGAPLPAHLVRAIALHDLAWEPIDDLDAQAPQDLYFDEERQQLHDFMSLPSDLKLPLYVRGVDVLERIDPHVALLVSVHYGAFMPDRCEDLINGERDRQARLMAELEVDPGQLERDYAALKALDMLSLYICQCAPGGLPEACPDWIKPAVRLDDQTIQVRFIDPHTVALRGCQLAAPISASLPYRELARRARDREALASGWAEAPTRRHKLQIIAEDGSGV